MLVAQHCGLRHARGAAGEEQHANVLRVHGALLVRIAASPGHVQEALARARVHAVAVLEVRQALLIGNQIGRLHPFQESIDLLGGKPIVDGHVRHARPAAGEERDRHGQIAHVQHGDAAGAGCSDVVGGRAGGIVEFLIGDGAAVGGIGKGDAMAKPAGGHLQQHHRVHGAVSMRSAPMQPG